MLAETPNEYRHNFVTGLDPAPYGSFLPDHQGQPAYVEIQKYSGGPYEQGADEKSYLEIESMRNNPNIYDPAGKGSQRFGSSLGGYFDIWERKFYFTGFAARVGLAQVSRADVATKVPEMLEPVWVKLSVGKAAKVWCRSLRRGYRERCTDRSSKQTWRTSSRDVGFSQKQAILNQRARYMRGERFDAVGKTQCRRCLSRHPRR
jgi:hypothetical protein